VKIKEHIEWLMNVEEGSVFVEHFSGETQNWMVSVLENLTAGYCYDVFMNIPPSIKIELDKSKFTITLMRLINQRILWKFGWVYWGPMEDGEELLWYVNSPNIVTADADDAEQTSYERWRALCSLQL